MTSIFRIKKPIPIPTGVLIDKKNKRIFVRIKKTLGGSRRLLVGKLDAEDTMYPNSTNFPKCFPEIWKEYTGELRPPLHFIKMGRYMATLAIALKNGLYELCTDALTPQVANAYMDYAMFSFGERSGATYLIEDTMAEQCLFSSKLHSDAWYSELFKQPLAAAQHQVKLKWLSERKECGHDKVILCIDGSNNDCDVKNGDLAEPGAAKSHTKKNIVGYIYAIDAEDGCPVTWDINPGGMHDVKAIYRIINRLKNSDLEVQSVIIDRGFGAQELLNALNQMKIAHVLMLKADSNGHQALMQLHASELARRNVTQLIGDNGIYGITDHAKPFKNSLKDECIGLFFDSINAPKKALKLARKVIAYKRKLEEKIAEGETNLTVDDSFRKYLQIVETEDALRVEFKPGLQKDMDAKGFFSIASSAEKSAESINDTYDLRDCSEKQYSTLKSRLGADATNVHSDQSILSKFFVHSLGSIILNEIANICKRLGFKTEQLIQRLDRCQMELQANGKYEFTNGLQKDVEQFFKELGIGSEHFEFIAEQYNKALAGGICSDIRTLPERVLPPLSKRRGRKPKPKKPEELDKPKRPRGRPKGSLNKSTIARQAREAANPLPALPKRRPGRPKGSLNKRTLRRLAREKRAAEPKKPVGRPLGRKNNKTLAREALLKELQEQTPAQVKRQPENDSSEKKDSSGTTGNLAVKAKSFELSNQNNETVCQTAALTANQQASSQLIHQIKEGTADEKPREGLPKPRPKPSSRKRFSE